MRYLTAGRHAGRVCCQPRVYSRYYRSTLTVSSFYPGSCFTRGDGFYRSRMFSLVLGLIFVGMAVGPLIGGITIHITGSTLSVFYLAATLHFIYIFFLILVLPESLTKVRGRNARLRHKLETEMNMNARAGSRIVKEIARFMNALTVLLPRDTVDGNPLKRHKKNWDLFLLAVCYAMSTSVIVGVPCVLPGILLRN